MTIRFKAWRKRLRALLSGRRFERALQRHRRAVRELDRAVREVLER